MIRRASGFHSKDGMKALKKYFNRYFVDAMGAMALGLFASLLISTIISTLATYAGKVEALGFLANAMNTVAT